MPRILTLHGDLVKLDRAAHILTATKHGQPLTDGDLEQLAGLINNSIVGASKLLHFVCPANVRYVGQPRLHFPLWCQRL